MVPANSPIHSLADLKGKKIAVAGGPLDKSWLLLRGLTERRHGFDPAVAGEAVFGAPPLLTQKAEAGEVDEIFEVPLTFFCDPANRALHSRMFRGAERFFFAYPFGDYYIWGATAGILSNLCDVLRGTEILDT
jgi:hypothetical protein